MRMRLKYKLQGFTLSEMMVVMVLTVVVVGLAFAILTLVQRQMETARKNYQGNTEVNLLRQALWHDMRSFPRTAWTPGQKQLELGFNGTNVTYRFEEAHVIRNGDTLDVPVYGYSFYSKGLPVGNGPIDALELKLSETDTEHKIFVFRPGIAADDIP